MARKLSLLLILLTGACTSSGGEPRSAQAQGAATPAVATQPVTVTPTVAPYEVQCKVSCSPTRLRTSVAEVSWKVATDGVLARAPDEHALDVTVYPDGFNQGRFARLFPLQQGRAFTIQAEPGRPSPLKAVPPPLDIRPVEVSIREQVERIVVRIEGLEPGLQYTWRVTTPSREPGVTSEAVSCMAPVCPANMQPSK